MFFPKPSLPVAEAIVDLLIVLQFFSLYSLIFYGACINPSTIVDHSCDPELMLGISLPTLERIATLGIGLHCVCRAGKKGRWLKWVLVGGVVLSL
jgi:hypothetical protein